MSDATPSLLQARPLNAYGGLIADPGEFMDAHVVNPMGAGMPPVCSCGWTPWGEFAMSDHIADMGEYVAGDQGVTLRPMQTSMVEGQERPVGPIPQSFVLGDNDSLIAGIDRCWT